MFGGLWGMLNFPSHGPPYGVGLRAVGRYLSTDLRTICVDKLSRNATHSQTSVLFKLNGLDVYMLDSVLAGIRL